MAGLHLKRNLYCHHPLWFAALLLGALPYVVVALVVRRHAVVNVGLCSRHRAVRRRDLAIAWALGLLAVVGFFLGFALLDSPQQQPLAPLVIIGSPVVLVAACIWGIARTSVLRARKIDRQPAWLRGAGPEFLAQIEQGA